MSGGAGVEHEVRAIAARLAGRSVESIGPEEPIFGGGLDLDSVTVTTLLAEIEESFGVSIPDADLDLTSLRRIDTLARLVASLHAGRG